MNITANQINVRDEETGLDITINNQNFYGPAIPKQNAAYTEGNCTVSIAGNTKNITFSYPDAPQEEYQANMWRVLDAFENRAWAPHNKGLQSGYACVDKAFDGGIYPGFIIVAGDSNLGKSAFVTNMVWNLIELNPEVYVMDISLDDAMPDKLSRMAACSGHLIINAVKTPLRYANYPSMLIRRKNAIIKLRTLSDRYMPYDSSSISTDVESIEEEITKKIEYFKTNNIKKKLVVCIDSFHDMTIGKAPSLSDKEKYDRLAQWCADIAIKYDITILCTGELKKLNGMRRPQMDDLRESVKIKYEAKAIMLVYNEVHYKGESADVYFNINNNPHKQPIFEVHFAKNKFGTYKGRNFFEFYPDMSTMKECSDQAQKTYSSIVYG